MHTDDRDKIDDLMNISIEKFIREASLYYNINEKSLAKLLEYYQFIPKSWEEPHDTDPVAMTLREISELVDLPMKVVRRLRDIKSISTPITIEDVFFMAKYRKAWGNFFLIRSQVSNLSNKQRYELISRPDLANKWERWVYKRYLCNEIKYGEGGVMLTPKNRIRLDQIADDVEGIFHVPKNKNMLNRIKKIREMAYNDRKKIDRDKKSEKDVLKRRTNMRSLFELEQDTYVFDEFS